ncbi:MAG: cysteine--tRNA ligase, partial [Pseudomonadota bacterium]
MTDLVLYNTATREKQVFIPLDETRVRLYVCGPTVYDFAHIGNARTIVAFDLLFRVLRHRFGADHVTYARNITDVDDKINARAAERGVPIETITAETTAAFHSDMGALNVLPPTVEPRATQHIGQMIALIEALIDKGHGYAAQGHALFHVPSLAGYGALSGRSVDDMIAGARIEVAPYKKDPMDFVLWKPSTADEPGWDSPWGRGRPGWHIECSAMAATHLGETFDIHGGGIDLVFPHHENEIAQSSCAHGGAPMARLWMHAGFLKVDGEKMSKSLGNFHTVHDLLADYPGEALRLQLLMTQYRQPLNWTRAGAGEAKGMLDRWYEAAGAGYADMPAPAPFVEALSDDLNSPAALAVLHRLGAEAREAGASDEVRGRLVAAAQLLGVLDQTAENWAAWRPAGTDIDEGAVEHLIAQRAEA